MDSIIERLWQIAYDEECVYPANPIVDDNLFIRLIDRCVEKDNTSTISSQMLKHLIDHKYLDAAVHLVNKLQVCMENMTIDETCEHIIGEYEMQQLESWGRNRSAIDDAFHVCQLFPRLSLYNVYLKYKDLDPFDYSEDEFFLEYDCAVSDPKWM